MFFEKGWRATSVALVFSLVVSTSYGADAEAEAEAGEAQRARAKLLDEVVVSGSRVATELSKTPVAIGRIGSDAMERDKPKDMGEILNRVAGVSWNDLGNEQHSMGIRQPNNTASVYQYLEDGIPIRPLGVFNHNSLNELNMSGAESVEVVKGPSSSLYGSNAVGGAVNFLTAKPSLDPYASATVRYDEVSGFTRIDTTLSDTFGDFGMRVSYYGSRRDEYNWQEYSYGDKDSLNLRADYALSDTASLRATFVYSNLDTAMTGSVFETQYRTNPGYSINTFTYRKDKALRASAAVEFAPVQDGTTTLTAFWRRNDHGQNPSYTIRQCASPTGYCGTINNNHVDSLGLDAKHVQEFGWAESRLIAGVYVDMSENPYVSDNIFVTRDPVSLKYVSYVPADQNTAVGRNGRRDYSTDILNYAPFFQFEVSPVDPLRIVVGGRYDSIEYDFTNNLTPGQDFGAPNEVRTFAHFSPKIGATYTFVDGVNVYVNASEGFTAPDVSQLYGRSAIPDLKPATYRNYELGTRLAFLDNALKFELAAYQLEGQDTIVSYTISPGNSENRNAGQTRSQGVEFSTTYDADWIDARLGATVAEHKFIRYSAGGAANQSYDGKEMPSSPYSATAELGVKPIPSLRLAVEGVYQSDYWMNNQNTVQYDGHTLVNIRGVFEIGKQWQAWLQGRNLTDERFAYSASSSYNGTAPQPDSVKDLQNQYTPGIPRSVMFGFTYTFDAK